MSEQIVAPWPGKAIGANWAWHRANGSLGGDDYVVAAGTPVLAIAAGTIVIPHDIYNTIEIVLADGTKRRIVYEENRSITVANGATVKIGQQIGVSGLTRGGITRWPHIHGLSAGGTRQPINEPKAGPSWVYTPAVVAADVRTTKVASNVRKTPSTSGAIAEAAIGAGHAIKILSYTSGTSVSGNAVWFEIATNMWIWSGDFTSSSTAGIAKYVPPTVDTPVVTAPVVVLAPPVDNTPTDPTVSVPKGPDPVTEPTAPVVTEPTTPVVTEPTTPVVTDPTPTDSTPVTTPTEPTTPTVPVTPVAPKTNIWATIITAIASVFSKLFGKKS